jgi:hypothetical protein
MLSLDIEADAVGAVAGLLDKQGTVYVSNRYLLTVIPVTERVGEVRESA